MATIGEILLAKKDALRQNKRKPGKNKVSRDLIIAPLPPTFCSAPKKSVENTREYQLSTYENLAEFHGIRRKIPKFGALYFDYVPAHVHNGTNIEGHWKHNLLVNTPGGNKAVVSLCYYVRWGDHGDKMTFRAVVQKKMHHEYGPKLIINLHPEQAEGEKYELKFRPSDSGILIPGLEEEGITVAFIPIRRYVPKAKSEE